MKNKVLAVLLLTCSMSVFAAKGGNFDERKQRLTNYLEQTITILQTQKTCVEAADNKKALKMCKKERRTSMKKLKADRKAERKERRAARRAAKSDS